MVINKEFALIGDELEEVETIKYGSIACGDCR